MIKNKKAFTLAEILITLSILGVVAAITIPSAMNRAHDKQTVVKLTKAFAAFGKAYDLMLIEDGNPTEFNYSGIPGENNQYQWNYRSNVIAKHLEPYFNIKESYNGLDDEFPSYTPGQGSYTKKPFSTDLGSGRTHLVFNCKDKTQECKNKGSGFNYPGFTTKDGVYYGIYADNNFNNEPGYEGYTFGKIMFKLFIDVNGSKGPNALGDDAFIFFVTDRGLHPGYSVNKGATHDNAYGAYYVHANCKKSDKTYWPGYSCGNYVIRHKNMDYKYKNLTDAEFY